MVGNTSNGALVAILAILTLVLGVFAGAYLFPKTVADDSKVVQLEEALAASKEKALSLEKSLAESEEAIEALRAEGKEVTETESKLVEKDYVDYAVGIFLSAVEDEEVKDGIGRRANKVDVLGNYDFDEMTVRKVSKEYTVTIDQDKTVIEFNIRLKFKEEGEASSFAKYDVTVIEYTDEDRETAIVAQVA